MIVAVDIETYDPNLKTLGDGSCRGDGEILCVGTFDGTRAKAYFPNTAEWEEFKNIMQDKSVPKIFHNGIYDLSWLVCAYDIKAEGLLHDTMTRMTYIDEYADLSLDACCKYFKVQGKNKADTIETWYDLHKDEVILRLKAAGQPAKKTDQLWKWSKYLWDNYKDFRDKMVEYNLQDCRATWYLYQAQEPKMTNVYDAYIVDTKLQPLIISMKKRGVRIDKPALAKLKETVEADLARVEGILINTYGIDRNIIASSKQLGARLNALGIHSPVKTKTGAESWGVDAINRIHHPVVPLITELKGYKKLLDTYLQGGMTDAIIGDRIHCTFSPNKREDGGTVTGRFACSKPNLQQIPARDKAVGHSYGQDMRAIFLPEEGYMMAALDYSQIEYLLLGHFAVGQQAEWFREQANNGVDFHTVAMQATGIPSRQVVKTFNYGVIYGMGWYTAMIKNYNLFEKLAKEHGQDIETFTKETYNNYHKKLPVIRDTMQTVQEQAKMFGYVRTIGGRYQHKPKAIFDHVTGKMNDYLYKMLNKLIQGSAADILKFALLDAYEAGVFDILKMHLTVHDENVASVPFNKQGTEACMELKHIMDNSFKDVLLVPMKAECELGPNWGYWSKDILNEMIKGNYDPAFFKKDYRETH